MTSLERLRIGDVERDRTLAALHDHFAAGRLGADELDQRLDATLVAKTYGDLEAITADLPESPAGVVPARTTQPSASDGRTTGAHPPWHHQHWHHRHWRRSHRMGAHPLALLPFGMFFMMLVVLSAGRVFMFFPILFIAGWLFLGKLAHRTFTHSRS